MPTVLMHTRPLDEKEKIVTGPRVAWLPPYSGDNLCPALPANRGCTPPSKPWVHTSSKTRLQHKLADTRAKQRTLRVRQKKPGRGGGRGNVIHFLLARLWWRQASLVTAVRGGSGCILGRCSWVRRDTPSAPRAHMLRSNPKRGLHGRRHRC